MNLSVSRRATITQTKLQLCKYLTVFLLLSTIVMFLGVQLSKTNQNQHESPHKRRISLDITMNPLTMDGARPTFWSYGPYGSILLRKCEALGSSSCELRGCNLVGGTCTKCNLFDKVECKSSGCDWSTEKMLCSQCKRFHTATVCMENGCFWHMGDSCAADRPKPGKEGEMGCKYIKNTVQCAKLMACKWRGRRCVGVNMNCNNAKTSAECNDLKKDNCQWNNRAKNCREKSWYIEAPSATTLNQENGLPSSFKLWSSFGQMLWEMQAIMGSPPNM